MKRMAVLLFTLPLAYVLLCGKTIEAYAEKFKPGDRAAMSLDINGDGVGETLVVESAEHDTEMGLAFELYITLTNPRGNVLYQSEEIGELDWFSVEKAPFEFEGGAEREIALIRTGCSGTGVHVNAFLLYQPPRVGQVMVTYEGNEGVYDADGNGVPDVFVSSCRMQNLGVIGAFSLWLPTFSRPSKPDNWESEDVTFQVLGQDIEYRQQWIDGIAGTCESIIDMDFVETIGEEHIKNLKMLKSALERNDMDEARCIYHTSF
jgi:hypothetical protein